ncbi:hypothetical protein Aab01nite_82820 [Paractinoplanes abujensis]|uniref:Uncharacterized protein n=1 Tax=Paractinoplanes abujensis TaxID=882441 RepID=A0A7W7FYQ5_9ACTN|nr:hypothetical protein [Actinoplanes abujensis]MBB4689904.1 hypothetical protein [Actinoplanes abujensis]GID24692.1 hypothetical protein Aab01nite_82820 [Actinoplanes abujensis]
MRLERRDLDLYIVAEWERDEGQADQTGPRRLAVEVAADSPHGITAGVMRRAARHLGEMTDEFNAAPVVGAYETMVRRYVEDRVAALPDDGDDYHRGLLGIHADLVERGYEAPEKALARAMRVPQKTVHACLLVARQRLGRESA